VQQTLTASGSRLTVPGAWPDFQREIADGQRILALKRAESAAERKITGIDPLPRPAPVERPPDTPEKLPGGEYTYSRDLFIYTELHAALVRSGLAGPAMLYDLLKWYARKRRTGKPRELLNTTTITRLATKTFGWSRRRVLRYLKAGEGTLWNSALGKRDRRNRIYHITGLKYVKLAVLGKRHPGRRAWLPKQAYAGHVGTYKAFVWEAFTKARDRAARETQAQALGVTKLTVLRWQKRSRLEVVECGAWAPPPANDHQAHELAAQLAARIDDDNNIAYWQSGRGNTYWQLTNRYYGGDVRIEKGRSGYIQAEANSIMSRDSGTPPPGATDDEFADVGTDAPEIFMDALKAARHQKHHQLDPVLVQHRTGATRRRYRNPYRLARVLLEGYRFEYSLQAQLA